MQKLILVQSDSIFNDQVAKEGTPKASKLAQRLSPLLLEQTARLVMIEDYSPRESIDNFAKTLGIDDIVAITSMADGHSNHASIKISALLADIGSGVDFLIAFAPKIIADGVVNDFMSVMLGDTDYQPAVSLGDGIVVIDCRQGYRPFKVKKA